MYYMQCSSSFLQTCRADTLSSESPHKHHPKHKRCSTTRLLIYPFLHDLKTEELQETSCISLRAKFYFKEFWRTVVTHGLLHSGLNVKNRTFSPEAFNISYHLTRSFSCETFFPSKCVRKKNSRWTCLQERLGTKATASLTHAALSLTARVTLFLHALDITVNPYRAQIQMHYEMSSAWHVIKAV